MLTDRPFSSPLDCFDLVESAREALLLSYTSNLAFFERFALERARSLGAVVTVLSDATKAHVDPRGVRYAGRHYFDGRAVCRSGGAFHPKLMLLVGDEQVVAAIGSGNLTVAGWHDNAEIWTVLEGTRDGVPRALHALAPWLRGLPEHVEFGTGGGEALGRVSDLLATFPDDGSGPLFVSSLQGRIIDQLPAGADADELIVSAPFFDGDAAALDALHQRLNPTHVNVALQPERAQYNGSSILRFLDHHGGDLTAVAPERYQHGKLVEWSVGGRRFALTGSPNASRAALTLSLSEPYGNCEIGLISEVESSLAPEPGPPIERMVIEQRTIVLEPQEAEVSLLLLGVLARPSGSLLHLAQPLTEEAVLERLLNDTWQPQGPVPAGSNLIEWSLLPPGAAIRLAVGDRISNPVIVCDLVAVRRPRLRHKGRVLVDPNTFWEGPGVSDAFQKDLFELQTHIAQSTLPPPPDSPPPPKTDRKPKPEESWQEYLDACSTQIGDGMVTFALGLPQLFATGATLGLDEESGDLEGDDATAATSELERPTVVSLQIPDDEKQLQRIRRFCTKLSAVTKDLPPLARLIALRLLLNGVAGGVWGDPAESAKTWVPLVSAATVATSNAETSFEAELQARDSLVALALAVLRGEVKKFSKFALDPNLAAYERAEEAALVIGLNHLYEGLIDLYGRELRAAFGPVAEPRAVIGLAESLGTADAIDGALAVALTESTFEIARDDWLLTVENDLPAPLIRSLLRVLSFFEAASPLVIQGDSETENGVIFWNKPDLVCIRRSSKGMVQGARYRTSWPGSFGDPSAPLPTAKLQWQTATLPQEIAEMMQTAGIDSDTVDDLV